MGIEELWVGTRVKHNKFGLGTVVFVDKKGETATVDFDMSFENKRRRIMIASVLSKVEEKPKPVEKPKVDDSQIKIGCRVEHKTFGMGTIVSLDEDHDYVEVDFDNPIDGKKRRPIMPSFLKVYVPKKTESKTQSDEFLKGDIVQNEQFGEGVVIERRGFFKSLVRFKDSGREETILNMHLTKVIQDIISEDEISDEEINSAFKIIPSNYTDQTCYSTNAKRLMTFLRKKYTGDGIATIKAYPEGDGEVGVLIVPDKGIVVFKMMNQELTADMLASTMFEPLANNQYSSLKNHYTKNFLMSKNLCVFKNDSYKILRYPTRFVLVYQNVDVLKMSNEEKSKIKIYCLKTLLVIFTGTNCFLILKNMILHHSLRLVLKCMAQL